MNFPKVNLTPVAIREAMAFIETAFKDNPTAYDHSNIASAVFTRPPVGTVGLTEIQARDTYGDDITVYATKFRPMKNALSGDSQKVFMKLITQGKDETVIGIHIVGDMSGEMIQAFGICVKAGLTKAQFDATCAVHKHSRPITRDGIDYRYSVFLNSGWYDLTVQVASGEGQKLSIQFLLPTNKSTAITAKSAGESIDFGLANGWIPTKRNRTPFLNQY